MNKGVLIWGYLASFILLLGSIFINQGFVAGKVFYLVGFLAFNLGYLIPLFYLIFKENQENKIGIFLLFGILGFFTFLTGLSFFVVSWGGGIALIYVGGGILTLAILTMIIVSRRFYETSIYSWFPVLFFGVFLVVSLLTSSVNRQVMRVFNLNNHHKLNVLEVVEKQNQYLLNSIIKANTTNLLSNNAKHISQNAKALIVYIDSIKYGLITQVKGDKSRMFEGERMDNLFQIQSNVEINSVKRYLLKKDKMALKLKARIHDFKFLVLEKISKDDAWLESYINVSLPTEKYILSERRYERSWEMQNFYEFPLVTAINQLTSIQQNVALVQKECLNSIYLQLLQEEKSFTDSLNIDNKRQ